MWRGLGVGAWEGEGLNSAERLCCVCVTCLGVLYGLGVGGRNLAEGRVVDSSVATGVVVDSVVDGKWCYVTEDRACGL